MSDDRPLFKADTTSQLRDLLCTEYGLSRADADAVPEGDLTAEVHRARHVRDQGEDFRTWLADGSLTRE